MDEQMVVVFKKDALDQVKNAARICGLPDNRLSEVLLKGIKLLELAENGRVTIDKNNQRLTVNVKLL